MCTIKFTLKVYLIETYTIPQTQLIESRGFSSELHYPVTMDGHILTLVRIINPFISDRSSLRPIYIQHGLFGSGDDFIISHKGRLLNGVYYETERQLPTNCSGANPDSMSQSVAYTLAACGYDVWLGNYRGNRYSNRHVVLSQSGELPKNTNIKKKQITLSKQIQSTGHFP